jgi:hypothetical protein
MIGLVLIGLLACSSSPTQTVAPVKPVTEAPQPIGQVESTKVTSKSVEHVGIHDGVQHPPIPADSPAWRHDPGGFVPDVRFYGERNWDGVRMRVAGHIAVIERDRARLAASSGDYEKASRIYASLSEALGGMIPTSAGPEAAIPRLAQAAATRDAALMRAIHAGEHRPLGTGLAGVRAVLLTTKVEELSSEKKVELRSQIKDALAIKPKPDIDAFADFDDRHQLRVKLWALYLDSVDPVQYKDPWGYFTWSTYSEAAESLLATIEGRSVQGQATKGRFTVDGAGAMPTGDSLIDVAGQPGPKSIGRLARLGLDDPKHHQWIEDTVYVLNAKLAQSPGGILPIVQSRTDILNAMGHGSRYYNIKQLRNETVRRLAEVKQHRLARQALSMHLPLHHQDWECPNREGILVAIDARLAAVGGHADAEARLKEARALSNAFLEQVAAVTP